MTVRPFDEMQLRFDLPDFDEVGDDAADRGISAEEARQISEAARQALGKRELPEWFENYLMLLEHGWSWRVAAYIAWAGSPKIGRKPRTLQELATDYLGLTSPRVISTWRRKFPSIDTIVSQMLRKDLDDHKADVIKSLIESASTPDYKNFNDRKLFLEITGIYTPRSQVEISGSAKDLSELSDEELDRLVGEGLTTETQSSQSEDDGGEEQ